MLNNDEEDGSVRGLILNAWFPKKTCVGVPVGVAPVERVKVKTDRTEQKDKAAIQGIKDMRKYKARKLRTMIFAGWTLLLHFSSPSWSTAFETKIFYGYFAKMEIECVPTSRNSSKQVSTFHVRSTSMCPTIVRVCH